MVCLANRYVFTASNSASTFIVDECAVANGGCAHVCQDTPFSYSCSCHEGFTLDDDKHNCTGE